MRGNVDLDALAVDIFGLQARLKIIQRRLRASGDAQLWCVHGAKVKIITQELNGLTREKSIFKRLLKKFIK